MSTREQSVPLDSRISMDWSGETLAVGLSGDWRLEQGLPSAEPLLQAIDARQPSRGVVLEDRGISGWDSGLLTFLIKIVEHGSTSGIQVSADALPEGVRRLLALARAVPARAGARKESGREPFLPRVGSQALSVWRSTRETVDFLGETAIAFARLLRGKATFRRSDLSLLLQECGSQALPIVSLISLLVGLILGFVGAIQLRMFGAEVFVADAVAIGMVRVMGAVMTGIIMAGRTGAAFAAQIGTMQVNEEIDALKTMGISPVEFLVLPRMIALIIMMPLLCVYADLMGILGGFVVGVGMLGINPVEYLTRTQEALTLTTFWIGLFHSLVFGVLVALASCLRGMQCGRSASDVGAAATRAVVTSIVAIIVATAVITFMCEVLNI
ncbi:ABC transporter permease [Desulfonatronum thioautotrophicum]|uniref:ABC transporter permease n=1 Tax=Desulfonatronum thioautotrophicum TaxID=617001 RepID=UPI0005EB0067|nr:ABC transporter permease [Desulfonatronum thioautotrophicum]